MARNDINLGMSVEEILKKINEEDIYILEISSDGGSLTETQFTQFKENFPYVSILLWYAGYQYLITNIQEYSYTYEGEVSKSYVGDITVNTSELRVTINENGIWTAQPFIPASKQISDISVGKRTLQKISLGRKKDDEGVSIVTEEIDEAGSISYQVNEDNSQSLTLTSEHAIEFKGNVDFSNATVTGLPSGEIPDNVAIYEGSANDSEIILSNTSVDNGIKASGIKIVPSGKDGQNVSNITYSDQEVPTSKNVRWALNEFGQNFAAADFSSSKFNQNEVIIGGEHLANLYAVKGSGAYFTNSSSFTTSGKPVDDTHIPTTKVVKTIVDDAIATSGGSSGGGGTIEEKLDDIITGRLPIQRLAVGRKITEGETETIEEVGAIEYNEDNAAVTVNGETILLDASTDTDTSHIQVGTTYTEVYSQNGRVHIEGGDGISLYSNKNDSARIELDATNDSENGKLILSANNISINGNVDFTNATVTGLNLGGGTLAIEVDELPTENIDDSKIYVLNEKSVEVFFHDGESYMTLEQAAHITIPTATIKYYLVDNFPAEPLVSNFQTFNPAHCYIVNNVPYVYGDAGAGNMWLTVSALFSQLVGVTIEDKGVTENIANETEMGLYVYYYEEPKKFYLYSNNQWEEIGIDVIVDATDFNGVFKENVIYRVTKGSFYTSSVGIMPEDTMKCNVVGELPLEGNPAVILGENNNLQKIEVYYVSNENKAYGYADENLSQIASAQGYDLSVGWHPIELVFELSGISTYKGIILDISQASAYYLYLIIQYSFYAYKNGFPTPLGIDTSKDYNWSGNNVYSGYNHFPNGAFFGDNDIGNSGTVNFWTKYVNFRTGTVAFNCQKNAYDEGGVEFNCPVNFTGATVTGLPTTEVDTSNLVTLDTEQTISGKKTFNGIKIGNANIEWEESGENSNLKIKIDENDGDLQFNADLVAFNSNKSVTIERAGMNGVNVSSSGIYIYDENVDTGNCANISFEDGIISLSSDNKIDFSGNVDFTNATVIGLPSGGLDIPSEVISYDSTNNSLSFNTKTLNFNASDSIRIENNLNWFYFTDTELQSHFGLELDDQNVMFSIAYDKENGTSSFYCDANIIDFTQSQEVKVNGLTLNGSLTLANGSGEIYSSEENLKISTNAPTSLEISTEEGGYININNEEMRVESFTNLTFVSNQDLTFVSYTSANIYVGENDETYFYISPSGMDVTANNGNINFSTHNQGSIHFIANGEESYSSINIYDSVIEYNAQAHQFFGEVDFSDATVTGLPSGSSDLTELKRVMRLLHAEKYTQRIQATKFTSTPVGSIHKIEKPSNGLLEASEYVLYSVDFEDAPAYPNATITIGNNGLINDSGTFSFTLQGSYIATGQNINVICVFVPLAFL